MVASRVEDHSVPSPPHSPDSLPRGRAHHQVGEGPLASPSLQLACLLPALTFFYPSWGRGAYGLHFPGFPVTSAGFGQRELESGD